VRETNTFAVGSFAWKKKLFRLFAFFRARLI